MIRKGKNQNSGDEIMLLSASVNKLISDLARAEHVPEENLIREALRALLREKKRAILNDQADILMRYKVTSAAAIEDMISDGTLPESPAWEDRIALDNLQEALRTVDRALASL